MPPVGGGGQQDDVVGEKVVHPSMGMIKKGLVVWASPPGGKDVDVVEDELHCIVISEVNAMNKEVIGASAEDPEEVAWYAFTDLYLINPFTRQKPSCDERIRLQILEQAPRAPTSGSEEGGAGERDGCRPSVGQSESAFGGLSSRGDRRALT